MCIIGDDHISYIIYSYLSPQFKYTIFHIFICAHPSSGTFSGILRDSQSNQLPDGLIAQLVEHCTGIAEVMAVPISFRRDFFFGLLFHSCLVVYITATINHKLVIFYAVQIYDLSYIILQSSHNGR